MNDTRELTIIVTREGSGFISRCQGSEIEGSGNSVEEAAANLKEVLEPFLSTASQAVIERLKEQTAKPKRFDP
jgi:predicted RNase H-like HicB family nuclease